METDPQIPGARQPAETTDVVARYSGHYLSLARRFVLTPGPLADGVIFVNGVVVVVPRCPSGMDVYHGGITALPEEIQSTIEWIDALRPVV